MQNDFEGQQPDGMNGYNAYPNQNFNSDPNQNFNSDPNPYQPQGQYQNPNPYPPQGQYLNPNPYPPQGQYQNPNPYPPQGQYQNPNPHQPQGQYQNPNPYPPQGQYQNPNPNPPQGQYQNPNPYQPQGQYQNPNQYQPQGQYRNPNPYPPQNPYQNPYAPNQGYQPFNGPPPKIVTDMDILKIKQRRIAMIVMTALIYVFIGGEVVSAISLDTDSPVFGLFVFLTIMAAILDYVLMANMFSIMHDDSNMTGTIIALIIFFGIAVIFAFLCAIYTYSKTSKYLTAAAYFSSGT